MFRIFNRKNRIEPQIKTTPKIGRYVALGTIILLIGLAGWFGYAIFIAKGKIITDNLSGGSILFHKDSNSISPSDLTGDSDGRVNILIMGIGGGNHDGAYLTDTIQVLSLDTQNHKAAMLSVPRDLFYKWSNGSFSRINEMYNRGGMIQNGNGAAYAKSTISSLLGIPIHYYILVDFQAFKQVVDTLGGITVNVDQPLDDCNYPNDIDHAAIQAHIVPRSCKTMIGDYIHIHFNVGTQQMNGAEALVYARSRHSTSDFDRSRRQQEVMVAIKQKSLSAGVITNPVKLTGIINILGDHVRTDLQISDLQALENQVKDLTSSQIITKVIDGCDSGCPLTGQTTAAGADVQVPSDGDYSYQAVKDIAHTIFTNPYLAKEDATIEVRNGTATAGLGNTVAAQLKTRGYNVVKITNNPTKEQFTQLINYSADNKPFTKSFLESNFHVKSSVGAGGSDNVSNFVLILGSDYAPTTTTK